MRVGNHEQTTVDGKTDRAEEIKRSVSQLQASYQHTPERRELDQEYFISDLPKNEYYLKMTINFGLMDLKTRATVADSMSEHQNMMSASTR